MDPRAVKKGGLVVVVFLLAILGYAYVFQGDTTMTMAGQAQYNKVLIIGIDGLDHKIITKLIDDGKLPNLKRLSESGTFRPLATSYPPNSPVAWTSIATGRNPAKHNIFDFIRRDPSNYLPVLSLSKSVSGIAGTDYESYVTSDPFWRLTSDAGVPTTMVRWPVTFPPERVEGTMLSGLGVPDIKGFLSGYSYYTSEPVDDAGKASNKVVQVSVKDNVIDTVVSGPKKRSGSGVVDVTAPMKITLTDAGATISVDGKDYPVAEGGWTDWMRAKYSTGFLQSTTGIFRAHLASREPFKLYLTAVQIDPENPVVDISYPKEYAADLAKEIGGPYYTLGMPEETDGFIDDKLSEDAFLAHIDQIEAERDAMFWTEFNKFKERDRGVLGFVYDSSDRMHHVFWDEKVLGADDGELSVNPHVVDYLVKKDAFIGKVLDELPDDTLLLIISDHGFSSFERAFSLNTWLAEEGYMTLKTPLTGDDDRALFQGVDWSKTRAYAVGFNTLYINVKGREGQGIVDPADRDALVAELKEKLEALTDEKTGKKVVYTAHRREDVHEGPLMNDAPDLIIGFYPGYRMAWQTAIGGFTQKPIIDNTKKWDGDHLIDPHFVPGILFSNEKLEATTPSQMDIAPTILEAQGIPIPADMDGTSLLS